jgi:cytochrome P450
MSDGTRAASSRKVDRGELSPGCPVRLGEDGTWYIQDLATAKAVLRHSGTRQAGFAIEQAARVFKTFGMRMPMLYRDGAEHREQRRQTAKYFTPRRVDTAYRDLIDRIADEQCETLRRDRGADLSQLAFTLSVAVVAEVVGLTEAGRGMAGRLERFFGSRKAPTWRDPRTIVKEVSANANMLVFYRRDVLPSIRERRKQRRDDVISHLIDDGASNLDILAECVMYASAGMITTREFISVAMWHLLTDDTLRATYSAGDEEQQLAVLQEILRLDPVVSDLFRWTTADVELTDGEHIRTIPAGAHVDISLASANLDPAAVGADPELACPHRASDGHDVDAALSFGDGAHRCPGSHIALLQTNIFLTKLLALPRLRMAGTPRADNRPEISSYEVTGLRLLIG